MKKYLFVLMCAILLVAVGCGNKNQVKCTGTQTEGGVTIKGEIIADLDQDNKVTGATASYDLGDETSANQYCSLMKLMENTEKGVSVNCSGSKITIKGYENIDADEEEDSIIGITKEEFIEKMQEVQLTCK